MGLHVRDTLQRRTSSAALSHSGHCFSVYSVKRSDGYKLTVLATLEQEVVIMNVFTVEKCLFYVFESLIASVLL